MVTPLIHAATMVRLIALDERAMPDTCTISTPGTPTHDDDNSPIPGATTTVTGIRCRMMSNPQAQEILLALRLTGIGSSVVAVPLGTVVTSNSQITFKGKTYEIVGTSDGASYATSLKLALRLVT